MCCAFPLWLQERDLQSENDELRQKVRILSFFSIVSQPAYLGTTENGYRILFPS
jgi:hypothetical protein